MTKIIPGLYGLDSASAWRALSKDPAKFIERFSKDKSVQKEIEYFNKKAPTFKDVDALVKDRRAMQYLLDSYGLGSEINNLGRIKKALTEDPTNENSLVNRLADPRFKAMAESLRLDQGMDKLQRLSFRDVMQDKYVLNEFEEALGDQDNALRQAAYFARNSGTISDVYSVMGDRILRDVVTSTFNLPQQLAIQSVETQAKVIAGRIDVSKFSGLASSVSPTALSRAQTDHTLIGKNLGVSDAALAKINSLQQQLSQLATDYANLGTVTDPGGANAALITVQEDAVPDLLRFEELLRKADSALGGVSSGIDALQDLITQAKNPSSNLADLKQQFSDLALELNGMIDSASATTYSGSENILLNGSEDTVDVTYNDVGDKVTFSRYDATVLKNFITDAESAFSAVVDSNDTGNLLAAEARLLRGTDETTRIQTQISSDLGSIDSIGSALYAATLNTTDLMRGKQSIEDSISRNDQVASLLDQINALATESKNRDPAADRSDLEASFDDYRQQIRDLIETPGSGLDNFLDGGGDQDYEIINGKNIRVASSIDLGTDIADVLDGLSLSDVSSATTLELQSIQLTSKTDAAKESLLESKPVIDRAVGTYDPRGRLDVQILDLKSQIDTLISEAAVDGLNLLDSEQSNISLGVLSTGNSLTFRAQNTFKADLLAGLDSVISQFANGTTAVLDAVDDVSDIISRAQRNLASDNRVATIEYGRLGATIDALNPQNVNEDGNVYKTNEFTQKFLNRYLGLVGSASNVGANSYLSNLFSGSDAQSATANLMSLALSIKA